MPNKSLTLKKATTDLRIVGITLRKVDGEYQVKPKGLGPDQTYYTNDIVDAFCTGLHMAGYKTVRLADVEREIVEKGRTLLSWITASSN